MKLLQGMRTKLGGKIKWPSSNIVRTSLIAIPVSITFSLGVVLGAFLENKKLHDKFYVLDPEYYTCTVGFYPKDQPEVVICVNYRLKGISFEPHRPRHREYDPSQRSSVYPRQ